ncbi:MAG: CoA ester lyase [Acidobacteria bacterium]|nr:CoA ester lyase [Acidobacteriota bacterium]
MSGHLARSYLYVPADATERLQSASRRGADAVIADLEDAVALKRKGLALNNTIEWLRSPHPASSELWVRVNPGERGLEEVADLFHENLSGICLAKVSGPEDIENVATLLDELENETETQYPVSLMPLIESATAVQSLPVIATASRVLRLQIGEIDLAADLGVTGGDESHELDFSRASVVVASSAAGLLPPVGAVSAQFRDLESFATTTRRLRCSGFVGRAAIHPAQIPIIHSVFTPSSDEIDRARRLVSQFDAALASGNGVVLGEDGRMVDEAVVRQSRKLLQLADLDNQDDETKRKDRNDGR